jgi:hypothetical protein
MADMGFDGRKGATSQWFEKALIAHQKCINALQGSSAWSDVWRRDHYPTQPMFDYIFVDARCFLVDIEGACLRPETTHNGQSYSNCQIHAAGTSDQNFWGRWLRLEIPPLR